MPMSGALRGSDRAVRLRFAAGERVGTVGAVTQDQIDDAVAEAERRRSISDRDLSASVQHFGAVVRTVCQEWGLTVERWLPGGAGTPPLVVRRADGSAAVLKIAEPGALDGAVRVMRAGDPSPMRGSWRGKPIAALCSWSDLAAIYGLRHPP